MVRRISEEEFDATGAEVFAAVASGETFLVTRGGVPVAEVRPVRGNPSTLVPKSELIRVVSAGPHVDARSFRRDLDGAMEPWL